MSGPIADPIRAPGSFDLIRAVNELQRNVQRLQTQLPSEQLTANGYQLDPETLLVTPPSSSAAPSRATISAAQTYTNGGPIDLNALTFANGISLSGGAIQISQQGTYYLIAALDLELITVQSTLSTRAQAFQNGQLASQGDIATLDSSGGPIELTFYDIDMLELNAGDLLTIGFINPGGLQVTAQPAATRVLLTQLPQ